MRFYLKKKNEAPQLILGNEKKTAYDFRNWLEAKTILYGYKIVGDDNATYNLDTALEEMGIPVVEWSKDDVEIDYNRVKHIAERNKSIRIRTIADSINGAIKCCKDLKKITGDAIWNEARRRDVATQISYLLVNINNALQSIKGGVDYDNDDDYYSEMLARMNYPKLATKIAWYATNAGCASIDDIIAPLEDALHLIGKNNY